MSNIIEEENKETKICNKCGIEKPLSEFGFRLDTKKYRNTCNKCINEQKKFRRLNPIIKRKPSNENSKICNKCDEEKDISLFPKTGSVCKACMKKYKSEYYAQNKERLLKNFKKRYYSDLEKNRNDMKLSYIRNREKRLKTAKEYRENNKEKVSKAKLEWQKKNKKRRKEILENYYINNKPKLLLKSVKYNKYKFDTDEIFRLKVQIRNLIRDSFNRRKATKNNIGCDIDFFINYLKQSYKNNYGYEWNGKEKVHIDHIVPLSEAKTEEEVIKLCHYTNLQLLKAKDNLEKHDKLNWELGENEE